MFYGHPQKRKYQFILILGWGRRWFHFSPIFFALVLLYNHHALMRLKRTLNQLFVVYARCFLQRAPSFHVVHIWFLAFIVLFAFLALLKLTSNTCFLLCAKKLYQYAFKITLRCNILKTHWNYASTHVYNFLGLTRFFILNICLLVKWGDDLNLS